jgi:type II secretory pathway pseudopilin PulG
MRGLCVAVALSLFAGSSFGQAQNSSVADPASALTAALAAACRADQFEFSNYLTPASAAAFRALAPDKREAFVKRFSLSDSAGRALVSTSTENHPVLHCQTAGGTAEFRLGETRSDDNLAWITVDAKDSSETTFGLVKQNGAWRLLSLGLVLLDVPQLSKQWGEEDLAARENAALSVLRSLAAAVESYRRAYGKLPDSLAQLGPAPQNGISPDQANLIDADLAAGAEAGYEFRYRIASAGDPSSTDATFEITAAPAKYGDAGHRSFFLDAAGKLHAADKRGALAEQSDPLIEPPADSAGAPAASPPS